MQQFDAEKNHTRRTRPARTEWAYNLIKRNLVPGANAIREWVYDLGEHLEILLLSQGHTSGAIWKLSLQAPKRLFPATPFPISSVFNSADFLVQCSEISGLSRANLVLDMIFVCTLG